MFCVWPEALLGLHLEGEGRRCVIGVCPEMKKIYLYLRVASVAGHELLCVVCLPPYFPKFLFLNLVFTDRILPHTPW